ncbi:MAG TPA: metallophosphoesterase family protein [Usitatibacter sp.]|nr:metallophosphoesterase family protein [Usitatibacter sp.]
MRLVVHLSDLHFGKVDASLLEPLRRRIRALDPQVLVVSGDLTQRAKTRQFREARAFLDTLPGVPIVVPGNHDVPLYDVFRRFLAPLARYKRIIGADLEPSYVDEEIAVVGVNTARSLVFKGGRINEEQVERIRSRLCRLPEAMTKIVVSHHPFDMPDDWDEQHQVVGRAKMALQTLAACGADVLLAGHMHRSHAGQTAETVQAGGVAALLIGAGTATSTRGRGEPNAFNALRIEPRHIVVEEYAFDAAVRGFELALRSEFTHGPGGWSPAG